MTTAPETDYWGRGVSPHRRAAPRTGWIGLVGVFRRLLGCPGDIDCVPTIAESALVEEGLRSLTDRGLVSERSGTWRVTR